MNFVCNHCGDSYSVAVNLPSYTATQVHDMAVSVVGEVITYGADGKQLGLGSCFVYTSDGKIVTNYHVIEGAVRAEVILGNVTYEVKQVLAYSPKYDLAVLKIDAKGLSVLPICTTTHAVGETVYAFGSSRGLTATFSQGIISYAVRDIDGVLCVQHDAAISPGNSGGPLINRFGEIIGINTFYLSDSQNLNFAVSVTELSKLDYSNPMTMQQVYQAERDPFQIMQNLLMTYGAYYEDDREYTYVMESVFTDSGDEYITYYDYDVYYDELEFNLTVNWQCQFTIYINRAQGVYGWYYADIWEDQIYGYQGASAFKLDATSYSYESYVLNDCETVEDLMKWVCSFADVLLDWLDEDLAMFGLTPEDFGFNL